MKTQKYIIGNVIAMLAVLATFLAGTASATVIANYSFTGGSAASADTELNSAAGSFEVSSVFGGNGGIGVSTATVYANSGVTPSSEAASISGGYYFSFTITPNTGYELNLASLTFNTLFVGTDVAASVNAYYVIRSSLDGFAANVGSTLAQPYAHVTNEPADYSSVLTARSLDLSGASFQNISSPVTFRIYIYDESSSSGKYVRLDDVILNGDLMAIPEPAIWSYVTVACLCLMGRVRRQSGRSL